jgi:hypothetical protein
MFLAAAGILFIAFLSVALIGITEARLGVRRLEAEIERRTAEFALQNPAIQQETILSAQDEALEHARFSSSLLSLSRAHSQARSNSPEPVLDESSSSELVPLSRSKSPVPQS